MVTLAFDVSNVDQDEAAKVYAPPPPPGMYKAKVRECKLGTKVDNGKAVPGSERLEIIYETDDEHNKGGWVYEYIQTRDDAHEVVRKRLTAFLLATGVVSKGKASGKLDPAKLVGKQVIIRVKKGANQNGDYKADIGGVWAPNNSAITASMLGPSQVEGHAGESGEYVPPTTVDAGPFSSMNNMAPSDEEEAEDAGGVAELRQACEAADAGDEQAAADLQQWFEAEVADAQYDPNEFALWTEWFDQLVADGIVEQEEEEESEEDEEEDADEATDQKPYSEWTLEELRAELTNRNQKTTGTKSQLVKRLEDSEEPF